MYLEFVYIYDGIHGPAGFKRLPDLEGLEAEIARARSAACRACTKHAANTSSSNFGPRRMRCNAKANGFVNATPPKN